MIRYCSTGILFFRVGLDLYFFVFLWSGGFGQPKGKMLPAQRLQRRAGDTIHGIRQEVLQYMGLEYTGNTLHKPWRWVALVAVNGWNGN